MARTWLTAVGGRCNRNILIKPFLLMLHLVTPPLPFSFLQNIIIGSKGGYQHPFKNRWTVLDPKWVKASMGSLKNMKHILHSNTKELIPFFFHLPKGPWIQDSYFSCWGWWALHQLQEDRKSAWLERKTLAHFFFFLWTLSLGTRGGW